jgi:hypothetical protein
MTLYSDIPIEWLCCIRIFLSSGYVVFGFLGRVVILYSVFCLECFLYIVLTITFAYGLETLI